MFQTLLNPRFTLILAFTLITGYNCLAQNLKFEKTKSFINPKSLSSKSNIREMSGTTLFAGLGVLLSFPNTNYREFNFYLTFSSDINFKIYKFLFLKTGVDVHQSAHNNAVAVQLNLIPEVGLQYNKFDLMFGIGGSLYLDWGNRDGIGAALKTNLKFDYFLNNKYGVGLEIKHLLADYDFSFDFIMSFGVTFKL